MGTYTVLYSAVVSGTASSGSPGDVLIPDATTGLYVKATTAARASRRSTGIALTSYQAGGVVDIIQYGEVPTTITGFSAAAASWVRCSATGTLEKVTPGAGDDILGKVDTDGRLFLDPGKWDSTNYAGGGGGSFTPPTGTGFVSVTAGALDAASIKVNLASGTYVTGTLAVGNGGTGITSLRAGMATWWGSGTSADLAAAVTDETGSGELVFSTAPLFKTTINLNNPGNTFKYVLTPAAIAADRILNLPLMTGTDTFALVNFAATLTNKTIDFGSNTVTFTSAQIKTACSDETGSGGALVFATAPALTDPAIASTSITNATAGGTINDCTLSGTAGSVRRVRFTNASGPTITGFDATGVTDGTILRVLAAGGTIAVNHENAGSAAANRVTLNLGATINIGGGVFTEFEYDTTASRWRHVAATAI